MKKWPQDSNQKIEIYQDIALCKDEKDIRDVIDELIDRFGNLPDEVQKLLEISRIKQLAKAQGVSKISSKREAVVFTYDNKLFDVAKVQPMIDHYKSRISFSPGVKPMITLKIGGNSEETILGEVKGFLLGTEEKRNL